MYCPIKKRRKLDTTLQINTPNNVLSEQSIPFPEREISQARLLQNLANGPLGCFDVLSEVMKFLDDKYFLPTIINYLKAFPILNESNIGDAKTLFSKRRILVCSYNTLHLITCSLLKLCNLSEIIPEIEIRHTYKKWTNEMIEMVQQFKTVHLTFVMLNRNALENLVSEENSKIIHLKMTDLNLINTGGCFNIIKPSFQKVSFNGIFDGSSRANPILHMDVSNIKEYAFHHSEQCQEDELLLSKSNLISKLTIHSKYLNRGQRFPNLEYLCTDDFSLATLDYPILDFTCVEKNSWVSRSPNMKTKTIIIRRFSAQKECSGIGNFISSLMKTFPNCEELIISETFEVYLKKSYCDFLGRLRIDNEKPDFISGAGSNLKRIVIKHSKKIQPIKRIVWKYFLEAMFNDILINIELEEITNQENIYEDDYFRSLNNYDFSLNEFETSRIIQMIQRMTNASLHSQSVSGSTCGQELRKLRGYLWYYLESKDVTILEQTHDSFSLLEGTKLDKEVMLNTYSQAIENYLLLLNSDTFYYEIIDQYCRTLEKLDETAFSTEFTKLEILIGKMKQIVEEKGFSSDILFGSGDFCKQCASNNHTTEDNEEEIELLISDDELF